MSPRPLPAAGNAALEDELLAQLGLPASASPEDVDNLHDAVSAYLAAAPSGIRGWARAQAAALDSAYLSLTDPVGLEGSALMSPTRPPTVVPGGPATPPARRDSDPGAVTVAAAIVIDDTAADADDEDDDEDGIEPDAEALAALYASVTPSAHEDMAPARSARPTKRQRREARRQVAAVTTAATPAAGAGPNIWKRITLIGAAVIAVVAIGFVANQVVNTPGATAGSGGTAAASAAPTQQAPSVDEAKVAALMETYAANPKDVDTLMALGDEFYFGTQYAVAGSWYDKVLAIDPRNLKALNAQGAVLYNSQDMVGAEKTWLLTLGVDPDNVEAHFNLGFLYMNQATPDFAAVRREWDAVIVLDPSSQFAQVAKAHLDSLGAASMLPDESGAPAASAAPAGSPASSPASSGAPSSAPSAAPAASPAAPPAASPVP